MKKTILIIVCFALVLVLLFGLAQIKERIQPRELPAEDAAAEQSEWDNELDEEHATVIELSADGAHVQGQGAAVLGTTVTIRYPGTYLLTGGPYYGQIVVDCSNDGKVYLELNNVQIHNETGPAIFVKQAKDTILELPAGTQSYLSDGTAYIPVYDDGGSLDMDQPGAVVHSRDDLHIEGSGTLYITGSYSDGIHCKDDLKFEGGNVYITAPGDGAKGTESLTVAAGTLGITAGSDGLQSTKGPVSVTGGVINIASGGDGVAAFTELSVSAGEVNVVAAQGCEYYADISAADISAKGLKADTIRLLGGTVNLDTADDGIHAEIELQITDGVYTVSSGDDGLNAGQLLTVSGGTVNVAESYEGLEALNILLEGGSVTVRADNNGLASTVGLLDEGISAEDCAITVSGGTVSVAAAQALNTDGAFRMVDGVLFLHGMSLEDDAVSVGSGSALEGGMTVITGCLTVSEPVPVETDYESLYYRLSMPAEAGTALELCNEAGEVCFQYTPESSYQDIFILYNGLIENESYQIRVGEEQSTVNLGQTAITTVVNGSGEMNGGSREMGGGSGEMNA